MSRVIWVVVLLYDALGPDLLRMMQVQGGLIQLLLLNLLDSCHIQTQLLIRSSSPCIFTRCTILSRHILSLLRTSTSLLVNQRLGLNWHCCIAMLVRSQMSRGYYQRRIVRGSVNRRRWYLLLCMLISSPLTLVHLQGCRRRILLALQIFRLWVWREMMHLVWHDRFVSILGACTNLQGLLDNVFIAYNRQIGLICLGCVSNWFDQILIDGRSLCLI